MSISKIFSLRNYVMKQIMKTNKEGIMQIPNKNKVDFGEMIIRENLFRKGIDPKTITNEQQLDNILNTPTVSPKPMPKKSGEVIDVDFGKPIDPEDMADGGVAGLLGERPGYNKGLSVLGFTPEHAAAVDEMDKNFTGSQFDYAAASTKDMVDRASNPLTAVASAVGNVVGRPAYDFVDAAQKYSDKGYQGEFSFTPQGAKDFYGNLKSLGSEFLNQKPGTMMGGALKGGIQSLGTTLGESIYDVVNPTPANADEIDMKAMMAKEAQFKKKQQQTKTFKQIEAAAAQKAAKEAAAKEAAAKEAAQRAATKQQAAQNKASGRGGYQSSWGGGGGGGFMGGSGTAAEMGSFADGGPARQNFAMGKRAFLKLMGSVGAGIAGLKTGIGLGGKKVATEVAKDVATGSGTPPPYFFNLVKKIKNLGDDAVASQDKARAYKYKDYTMEEDFAGNIEIKKTNYGMFGDEIAPTEEVYISYRVDEVPLKGRGKKKSTKVEEYEEYTARPDEDGKMKDVESGVPDDVIEDGTVFEDNMTDFGMTKKASGGRVPLAGGGGGFAFKLAKKYRQSKQYKDFIEKLFVKTSNEIRRGEGAFKNLSVNEKIKLHDDLTKEVTNYQKTGELPESAHQYFGFNPEQQYADSLLQKQLKMTPEEELRQEFPGILTDEMVSNILTDTNQQRIAEVKATMKEALKMQEKGMGTDEILQTFEKTPRTKNASGGIARLLGE